MFGLNDQQMAIVALSSLCSLGLGWLVGLTTAAVALLKMSQWASKQTKRP